MDTTLGQPDAARDYAGQAQPGVFPNVLEMTRLVASDLRHLKKEWPTLAARIDEYLAEYLQGRPRPKADLGD